jgi:hypothetical protein
MNPANTSTGGVAQTPGPIMVKPTVGRMVYYKSRGSADGVFPPINVASIITGINNDGSVSLVTFYPTGLRFETHCVQGQEIAQWDWMPFQKDQAARMAPGTINASHPAA